MEFNKISPYYDGENKLSKGCKARLLLMFEYLKECKYERVTSGTIADCIGCKSDLVRQDLRKVLFERGYKNGYSVKSLLAGLEKLFLTEEKASGGKRCCVVGLGRLGAALLDESFFENSAFTVLCGFDSSVNRLEIMKSTFELFPASYIESVCRSKKIEYALLCCAEKEAQIMTERLEKAGIKGIVNYTRSVIKVSPEVKVNNSSPYLALMGF